MTTFQVGFSLDLTADVVLEDGTKHRVGPFGPRDLVAFERHFRVPSALLAGMVHTEWVAFLAFTQLSRRGVVSGDFDSFVNRVDDLTGEMQGPDAPEEDEEDEEPGPATEPSPSGSP